MKEKYVKLSDLVPYEKNPRKNAKAVGPTARSMEDYGYVAYITVGTDNVIVMGHTRRLALLQLQKEGKLGKGMLEDTTEDHIKVIDVSDLSEEKQRELRIIDNQTGGLAEWDWELLSEETQGLDLDWNAYGYMLTDDGNIDFENLESRMGEKSDAYNEFVDKFKVKHTTDDCFTPPAVYEAVSKWVAERYHHKGEIVRPFYPGGDYRSYDYPKGCLVLDNPPFSLMAEIVKFYIENKIDYFLFANHLTLFNSMYEHNHAVVTGANIIYENGANVNTSFLTSLEEGDVRIASSLRKVIEEAQPKETNEVNRYDWPDHVLNSARLTQVAQVSDMTIPRIVPISTVGGVHVFGGGGVYCEQ